MKNSTLKERKLDPGDFKPVYQFNQSPNLGNAFVSGDIPPCKEPYSKSRANATERE
jgi:hypothetical protein